MIQTTIRELKDGQFFTFRPHEYPKERQVYVRSRYDRSGKKFAYFPYSDMMDEHFAKGSRVVFTDFNFWFMNIKLTKEQAKLVFISVSACIREETRDMVIAESKGFKTKCYLDRIAELQELKTIISNQVKLWQEETD